MFKNSHALVTNELVLNSMCSTKSRKKRKIIMSPNQKSDHAKYKKETS